MHFNEEKATSVASFFLERAGSELEDLKLMKLMYLAEREAILQHNAGITGDIFYSMQNGPVLSETLRLMQGQPKGTSGKTWNRHIASPEQWKIKLTQPFHDKVLSRAEETIVGEIWDKHGRKNKWRLVDLTHTFPEWDERARTRRTSIPIPMIDILEALELKPKVIESRLSEMRAMDYFEDLLSQGAAGLLTEGR